VPRSVLSRIGRHGERVFAGAREGKQNPPSSPVAGEGGGERNIGRWAVALLVVVLGWRLRSGWVQASPEAEGVGGGERCVNGFGERNRFGGRCVNGGE
jgi:hypothetical protein